MITLIAALILCVATLGACLQVSAKDNTEYVKITGNGFVADTFQGVNAIYNLTGKIMYCTELVQRFYNEKHGVSIQFSNGGPVSKTAGYKFVETADPKAGDVLYASPAARGKSYGHWAICKSVSDGTITLFEQNWRWNGSAAVGRTIPTQGSGYRAYRLVKA